MLEIQSSSLNNEQNLPSKNKDKYIEFDFNNPNLLPLK